MNCTIYEPNLQFARKLLLNIFIVAAQCINNYIIIFCTFRCAYSTFPLKVNKILVMFSLTSSNDLTKWKSVINDKRTRNKNGPWTDNEQNSHCITLLSSSIHFIVNTTWLFSIHWAKLTTGTLTGIKKFPI